MKQKRQTNSQEIYSDHLPQLFNLQDSFRAPIKILTYNIAATGTDIDGFVYGDNQEILINTTYHTREMVHRRLDCILSGIRTMVEKHQIDVIALQEAPLESKLFQTDEEVKHDSNAPLSLTVEEMEKATGLKAHFLEDSMWILYDPHKIEPSFTAVNQLFPKFKEN